VLRFEGMRLAAGFVCCCGEGDLAVEHLSWLSSLLVMKGSLEAFKGTLSLTHRLRTDPNLLRADAGCHDICFLGENNS